MAGQDTSNTKHARIKRAFVDTVNTLCIFLAVRWFMGERIPGAGVLARMLLGLLCVIFVMEWLEQDPSAVVGVARANVASKVLGMAS